MAFWWKPLLANALFKMFQHIFCWVAYDMCLNYRPQKLVDFYHHLNTHILTRPNLCSNMLQTSNFDCITYIITSMWYVCYISTQKGNFPQTFLFTIRFNIFKMSRISVLSLFLSVSKISKQNSNSLC